MSYDEMELDTLGDRKTALFLIMSDTDSTFNFLISMIYSQLFNLLCEKADDQYHGRLPVHVRCLIDECAKSAVAAAYRAGEKLTNDFDGETHDYTHKGGVVHTEILLPDHAPSQYADRAVLWNAVEKIEKAKNAQLAREIELPCPVN